MFMYSCVCATLNTIVNGRFLIVPFWVKHMSDPSLFVKIGVVHKRDLWCGALDGVPRPRSTPDVPRLYTAMADNELVGVRVCLSKKPGK